MWWRETNAWALMCCTILRNGPCETPHGGESTVCSVNSCQLNYLFERLQMAQTVTLMWRGAHHRAGEKKIEGYWGMSVFIPPSLTTVLLISFTPQEISIHASVDFLWHDMQPLKLPDHRETISTCLWFGQIRHGNNNIQNYRLCCLCFAVLGLDHAEIMQS